MVKATVPDGDRYRTTVPDTLDLAERGSIALNALNGALDLQRDYEMYFLVRYGVRPPYMYHDAMTYNVINPKWAESFAFMRAMSGNELHLDWEQGMMEAMLKLIGRDGLYYAVYDPLRRPWHEGTRPDYRIYNEDFTNVYGDARFMLAMMAWHQRDGDPGWLDYLRKMASGLCDIAIDRGDYAYYPDGGIGDAFSYARSGWKNTDEPHVERMGAEGSMFMYHCGPIRALARWYQMSGDERARDVATKLVRFVMHPRFWGGPATIMRVAGPERAHFVGHYHGHIWMLWALLDYALAVNDNRIKQFARDGYEFARSFGIARIGWVDSRPRCESCSLGDLTALAIRLTDAGIGDYWEDIDQLVRNQLVETQLLRPDLLERISRAGPVRPLGSAWGAAGDGQSQPFAPGQETADRVIERTIGSWAGYSMPTTLPQTWIMHCCTANASQGVYYAWEGIIREQDGTARVNLLLNRASPWVDVDSYLPYAGKVVFRIKTADRVFVRIPNWVDRKQVAARVNGETRRLFWLGNYLGVGGLHPGDVVTIEFPVAEETQTFAVDDRPRNYKFRFRGNTVVDVAPRDTSVEGYPIYLRDQMKEAGPAPMKEVVRYAASRIITW